MENLKKISTMGTHLSRSEMKKVLGGVADGYTCWCDGNKKDTEQVLDANDTISWGQENCKNTFECVKN